MRHKMESNGHIERKVGIFVALSVFALLTSIFLLGGDKAFFRSYIQMKVNLEETSGLTTGAVVQIVGLPVGNVLKISFDENSNLLVVDLKIDKRFASKITKGSTASIRTQGALGDKFIMIRPGPANAEILEPGATIASEEDSDLLSTLGKSGGKIEKIFEILDRVNKMVSDLEKGRFAKNLANSAQGVQEAIATDGLKKGLVHFGNIMQKIDKGQGTLGALINDPTVHEDLKSIMGGAKRSNLLKYLIRQTVKSNEDGEKADKVPEKKK